MRACAGYVIDRHLTTANVNPNSFGTATFFPADGQLYPQVLFVPRLYINGALHDVAFGATENSSVYAWDLGEGGFPVMLATPVLVHGVTFPGSRAPALGHIRDVVGGLQCCRPLLHGVTFLAGRHQLLHVHANSMCCDAATGAVIWMKNFLGDRAVVDSDIGGCTSITPNIGIVSTPVIDTPSKTIYFVAQLVVGGSVVHRCGALLWPPGWVPPARPPGLGPLFGPPADEHRCMAAGCLRWTSPQAPRSPTRRPL